MKNTRTDNKLSLPRTSFQKFVFFLILISLFTINPEVLTWNDASRMATIQSMVENNTLEISGSTFRDTGDKVFINERFYSSKPIFGALLGVPFYYLLFHLGIGLSYGSNLAVYLIILVVIKVSWILGILAVYRILKLWGLNENQAIKGGLAVGIGSLFLTYSSIYSNNLLSASFIVIGFYFVLCAARAQKVKTNLFLSGLFFSLTGAVDLPTTIFFVIALIYILFDQQLRKSLWIFCLPLLLTFLPTFFVYYSISGSIIPVNFIKTFYVYPDSPWINSDNDFVGFSSQSNDWGFVLKYIINTLFWERGIFLYNPFLIISMFFLTKEIIKKREHQKEALLVVSATGILLVFYLFFTANYGGSAYGFRWLVPILPINFLWLFPFLKNPSPGRERAFWIILAVSIIIAVIGLANPWSNISISNHTIIANIVEIWFKFIVPIS